MEKWKGDLHRHTRATAYLYLVPLLGLAYTIPAAQLVFLRRADSEQCFFNFGCALPWAGLDAFNHVYSNVGYIGLGGCFLLLVWAKEPVNNKTMLSVLPESFLFSHYS